MSKFPTIERYKDLDALVAQVWKNWKKRIRQESDLELEDFDVEDFNFEIIDALYDISDYSLHDDKVWEIDEFKGTYAFLKNAHRKRKQIVVLNIDDAHLELLFLGTKAEIRKKIKKVFKTTNP